MIIHLFCINEANIPFFYSSFPIVFVVSMIKVEEWHKKNDRNFSNKYGDPCARGVKKDFLYKTTRTWKIKFLGTHKVTWICYGPY